MKKHVYLLKYSCSSSSYDKQTAEEKLEVFGLDEGDYLDFMERLLKDDIKTVILDFDKKFSILESRYDITILDLHKIS